MAALLAHALATHLDPSGRLGPPHDSAHVAYTLGRNWVFTGAPTWLPEGQGAGLEAYASPLWIGVSALAERLYLPVTHSTQMVGLGSALLMVFLSARFATDRLVGILPPLLFVTCGSLATAATSGTEWAAVAMFVSVAFVAMEHRHWISLAGSMSLLIAARPEGVLFVVALLVLALVERISPRRDGAEPAPWWPFLVAGAVTAALCYVKTSRGTSLYGDDLKAILDTDPSTIHQGALRLLDFATTGATPLLIVFPLIGMALRRLSGAGVRGLFLALAWALIIVVEGGPEATYHLALVPAIGPLFIAVQAGVIALLDTNRRWIERLSWTVIVVASMLSALGSRFPTDLGPLPLAAWSESWLSPAAPVAFGESTLLGREALNQELARTARQRALGLFLRDQVQEGHSILTPWPGALGYLSGLEVRDMMGRIGTADQAPREEPWAARPRTDLVRALSAEPDFVQGGQLLGARLIKNQASPIPIDLLAYDVDPSAENREALAQLLSNYELVILPLPREIGLPSPFPLLRRRALGLTPELRLLVDGSTVTAEVRIGESLDPDAQGHPQLVELWMEATDAEGRRWLVDPAGRLRTRDNPGTVARAELMLLADGVRPVRLGRWTLPEAPDGVEIVSVSAQLLNPTISRREALSRIGHEVQVDLN